MAPPRPYGVPTPDTATVFESSEAATRVAVTVVKHKKSQFRCEETPGSPHRGIPPGWIVRIWPLGAHPICGERLFIRVPVARRTRKPVQHEED